MTACSQDDDSDDEKPGSHYVELEQQAVNENALREAQEAFARRKEQSDMVCNSISVVKTIGSSKSLTLCFVCQLRRGSDLDFPAPPPVPRKPASLAAEDPAPPPIPRKPSHQQQRNQTGYEDVRL